MGRGHLFVVDGNLERIAVDAWYLPLDDKFRWTPAWQATIDAVDPQLRKTSQIPWGEGELVRYFGESTHSDVWVGNVGRQNGADAVHYINCARQFIMSASEKWRKDNSNKHRLPIVGINHLGTGNGGARESHGELITRLVSDLSDGLNSGELQADVVLVSYGSTPESAAQCARYKRTLNWQTDPQWQFDFFQDVLHATAERLAKEFHKQRTSIFMGAGVSKGAGLPSWRELLIELGGLTNPPTTEDQLRSAGDPRDQAKLLERRFRKSGQSLAGHLRTRFDRSKYSLQHGLLSSLPCDEFITTNVDELFEKASSTADHSITVMPKVSESRRWLLKLHGTVSIESSLVFTRDNYIELGRTNRALFGLVQAMLFTRHMIFVGYGLGDEDFHEVVYDVRSAFPRGLLGGTLGTALTLIDDPIKTELWEDVLEIIPMRPAGEAEAEAARDLERFLDLVGMLASDRSAFLLDSRYQGLRDTHEQELANALSDVNLLAMRHLDTESSWRDVRQLLKTLGGLTPQD
jgi:SIR2-like domain